MTIDQFRERMATDEPIIGGSVVTHDIPANSIAVGNKDEVQCTK